MSGSGGGGGGGGDGGDGGDSAAGDTATAANSGYGDTSAADAAAAGLAASVAAATADGTTAVMGFNPAATYGQMGIDAGQTSPGQTGIAGLTGIGPSSPTGFGSSTDGIGGLGVGVSGYGYGGDSGGPSGGLGGGISGSIGPASGAVGMGSVGSAAGFGGGGGSVGYGVGGGGGGGSVGYGGGGGGSGGSTGGGSTGGGSTGGGSTGGGSTGGNAGGVGGGGHGAFGNTADMVRGLVNSPTQPQNVFNQYHLGLASHLGSPSLNAMANAQRGPMADSGGVGLAGMLGLLGYPQAPNMGFPSLGLAHTPSNTYASVAPPGSHVGQATIGSGHGTGFGQGPAAPRGQAHFGQAAPSLGQQAQQALSMYGQPNGLNGMTALAPSMRGQPAPGLSPGSPALGGYSTGAAPSVGMGSVTGSSPLLEQLYSQGRR